MYINIHCDGQRRNGKVFLGKECAKSYSSAARQRCKHPNTNTHRDHHAHALLCTHTHTQTMMPTCSTHVAELSSCRGVLVAPEGSVRVMHSSCPLQFPLYLPSMHRDKHTVCIHGYIHLHTSISFQTV